MVSAGVLERQDLEATKVADKTSMRYAKKKKRKKRRNKEKNKKKKNLRSTRSWKQSYSITDLFFSQTSKIEQKGSGIKAGTVRSPNCKAQLGRGENPEGILFRETNFVSSR